MMSKRLAVFNYAPNYCPNCGQYIALDDEHDNHDYHNARASFSCRCDFSWGKVDSKDILNAHEDLREHHGEYV